MVNRGVSRGCGTCRQRRKKCDETRPVCKACTRVGRECLGYRSESDLLFRHYDHNGERALVSNPPKPDNLLFSSLPSPPSSPREHHMTNEELVDQALDVFLRDYCIEPGDPALSRGYLQGAASIIRKVGRNSDVANAARIIAIDGIGRRWGREQLEEKARWLYQTELQKFQHRMTCESLTQSPESLMIVTLFGLYEILGTPFPAMSGHAVHALGITALIGTNNSPFSLFGEIVQKNMENLLLVGIFTPPCPGDSPSLDHLFKVHTPIFERDKQLFNPEGRPLGHPEELRKICFDAEEAFEEIALWSRNQHPSFMPQRVGFVSDAQVKGTHGSVFWPGPVDSYIDHWVATVWSTVRKGVIMLAATTAKCAAALPSDESVAAVASRLSLKVQPFIESMLASIPFYLLDDVHSLFGASPRKPKPGLPVAGLLSMHPIYITSYQKHVISTEIAEYLLGCLRWMSEWQGLGQARVLFENSSANPKLSIADAHTIVWTGMAP